MRRSRNGRRRRAIEPETVEERLLAAADAVVEEKSSDLDTETWTGIEKSILLQNLDHHWKEHLAMLDALRQVVHLRAYAQKTPINEYKQEAFAMFERMLGSIREDVTRTLAYRAVPDAADGGLRPALPDLPDFITSHLDPFTGEDNSADWDAGTRGLLTQGLPPLSIPQPIGDEIGEDPAELGGRGQPQRAVPVRVGAQVQALPRRAGVMAQAAEQQKKAGERSPALFIPVRAVSAAVSGTWIVGPSRSTTSRASNARTLSAGLRPLPTTISAIAS